MDDDGGQVTQLLKAMHAGDTQAAESLLPLVYAELHRLAKGYMRQGAHRTPYLASNGIDQRSLSAVGGRGHRLEQSRAFHRASGQRDAAGPGRLCPRA